MKIPDEKKQAGSGSDHTENAVKSSAFWFKSGHRHHAGAKYTLLRRLFYIFGSKDVIRPITFSAFPNQYNLKLVSDRRYVRNICFFEHDGTNLFLQRNKTKGHL